MTDKATEGVFREVGPHVDVDALELSILDYWDREKIFERLLEQTKNKPLFSFYDGPPYATGKPHYGHILQSAIKDTVLRYKSMQGFHVPRRVGWDCHGLPVENLVEKELGIKTKKDIEADIAGFNAKCRDVVFRYIDDFTSTLKRLGRWAHYDNAYATLDRDYMESEWWVFSQLWNQNLIYKSFRSTPYCIRCATPLSNFEVGMAYKDTADTAVYVLLPVSPTSLAQGELHGADEKLWLLIWTTTPWTLPGNVAVAIGQDIEYVTVAFQDKKIIVGKDRVEALFGSEAVVEHVWDLQELLSLRYEPLYQSDLSPEEKKNSFRVVTAPHVTAQDGTGIVHMAPAFGEEDFVVSQQAGLPVLRTVGVDGRYLPQVPLWAGQQIFETNDKIVEDLKGRGLLFKQETYQHSYPFCWRCDTPLIYYALDSWFVKVTDLKDKMLATNEDIHWVPNHVQHGRFGKGVESAPDWCISRNRFWSVPLPVWVCDACGQTTCVGSVKELQNLSGADDKKVADIHRPFVDDITWPCKECGQGTMTRVLEVLDVWFDSGSMPYAQWHYPFANKELVEQRFPADFIAESIEMTRAWFYSLHVLATALTSKDIGLGESKPAYKNVIASGIMFATDGQKLSKKLSNYPDVEPTFKTYGADVLRFYLLTSASLGEPYRFSETEIQQLKRSTYATLWNVYSFFVRYANVHGWQASKKAKPSTHALDLWLLARINQLVKEVQTQADSYNLDTAARLFIPFIDDLSNWYVRRSRERFQKPANRKEMDEAFGTLHETLLTTSLLMAPFMPFISEEIYRNLSGQASVHLALLPKTRPADTQDSSGKAILTDMKRVREIVTEGLAVRARAKIKVRQPLLLLQVAGEELTPQLSQIIADEVNVKAVAFGDFKNVDDVAVSETGTLALTTTITAELQAEGTAREIIRFGQVLRREANLALDDQIKLVLTTEDENLQQIIKTQEKVIQLALQAVEIMADGEEDAGQDVKVQGVVVHIGVKKL